jgi:hypothetical protein
MIIQALKQVCRAQEDRNQRTFFLQSELDLYRNLCGI